MSNHTLLLPAVMAVAELAGAAMFVTVKDDARRALLSCFGLGFAVFIVVADILPDAVTGNPLEWLVVAAGLVAGAALMLRAGRGGAGVGNAAAIAGMALHNVCEGIVLAAAGPAVSALVFVGAVAHKLPEGMVVFSLADGQSPRRRWALAAAVALLIPVGTAVVVPEGLQQSLLAFAAGIMLVVLSKALMLLVVPGLRGGMDLLPVPRQFTAAGAATAGVVLAGLSCLVV